jgi:hypothetical protein
MTEEWNYSYYRAKKELDELTRQVRLWNTPGAHTEKYKSRLFDLPCVHCGAIMRKVTKSRRTCLECKKENRRKHSRIQMEKLKNI